MRGLIHKQKQNLTLKNISEPNSSKLQIQQNRSSSEYESINANNIRQWICTKRQQDDSLKQKHPFSIFVVPTNKVQSKILNSLLLTKHNSQEKHDRSNSQRINHLPAKNMTEFSHRKRVQANISRKIQRERKEQAELLSNKSQKLSQSQLENIQKRNEKNLIDNIQHLIKAEHEFIPFQQSSLDTDFLLKKQGTKCFQDIMKERLADQMVQQYNRTKKQLATIKFKQNIKNKLSRRHIYHTLKHKSEAWHKIRVRTHQHSPYKQNYQQQSFENKVESPLHYGSTKHNFRNLPFNQLKDTNISFYEAYEQLRVQSKPAKIQLESPKKIKQEYIKANSQKSPKLQDYQYKNKTLTQFNIKRMSNPEVQSNNNDKNQKNKFRKNAAESEGMDRHKSTIKTQEINIFRQLTPWHGDYLQ